MKSELLQVVENMKRFSSAMALMITSVCFWNMDLFPSTIHMLVFMSQKEFDIWMGWTILEVTHSSEVVMSGS